MKSILSFCVVLLSASFSFAQQGPGPCENYAKYGALRVYHAMTGPIQRWGEPNAKALYHGTQAGEHAYTVTIADNDDDGSMWETDFAVRVRGEGKNCQVLFVKDIDQR